MMLLFLLLIFPVAVLLKELDHRRQIVFQLDKLLKQERRLQKNQKQIHINLIKTVAAMTSIWLAKMRYF